MSNSALSRFYFAIAAMSKPTLSDPPVRTGSEVSQEVGWGSDAIVEQLSRLNLCYIAILPGSSYRGTHDSLVNYKGNCEPEMLVCLHEEHAISIAHGYAKVTERPMAAAVHANVGLMHASMAIYNAFCDRVPMLIRVLLDRWMRQNGDHGSIGFTQLEIKEL
jgi:hypothetical protein